MVARVARGRTRGRFPLRAPAYAPVTRRRRPPAQPLAQTVAVGLVTETDTVFTVLPLVSPGADTFEATPNGTLSTPWAAFGSKALPQVVSGDIFAAADLTMDAAAYGLVLAANMRSEITLSSAPTVNTNMAFDVYARISALTSAADYYIFRMYSTGWRLLKRTGGGAETIIAQVNPRSQTLNTITGLRVTAVGSTLTGYAKVSGTWTQVIQVTDTSITAAGYGGFGTQLASAGANPIGIEEAAWGPASYEVSVGQSEDTQAAQVVRHIKTLAVGLTAATNTALAGTARKTKTLGQPSESGSALALTAKKTRAVAQALESDAAQQLRGNIIRLIGQAAETETAQTVAGSNVYRTGAGRGAPLGSRGRERGRYPLRAAAYQPQTLTSRSWALSDQGRVLQSIVPVGQAVETDTARNLITAPKVIAVGQAAETETALGVLRQRRFRSGFPYPVDTVVAGAFIVVTQVTDPQTAISVTHRKTRAVGQAAETETPFAVGAIGAKVIAVGQAAESDTPLAARRIKSRTLGLAAETELAQATTRRKVRTPGIAAETDTSLTAQPRRTRAVGLVTETELAQPVIHVKSRVLGQTLEFETSQVHTRRKRKTLGLPATTESARPVTRPGRFTVVVEIASETDTAQIVARRKSTTVGLPQENETAHPVTSHHTRTIPVLPESDTAFPLRAAKVVRLAQANETDQPRFLGRHIGIAVEPDTAHPVTRAGSRVIYVHRLSAGRAATGRTGKVTRPRTGVTS